MKDDGYRVLLVDDYEINLELLEAYLSKWQWPMTIFKAQTGEVAWEIILNEDLDVVLLDVMLPDISGYDICRRIKDSAQFQTLPVVMITALSDRDSMYSGLKSGADEFLSKPVDGNELLIRLKNLLKLRKVTHDLNYRYQQLERELHIADALQRSFLPASVPQLADYAVEVVYKPSGHIGGDFYDFLPVDDHRLGIFISDVKGHGVASAMITAMLKDNINKLSRYYDRPRVFFQALNGELSRFFAQISNDFFITAFYGVLDYQNHTLTYSNAGGSLPYLFAEDAVPLDTATGFPLGIFENGIYEEKQTPIPPDAEIFLHTDGIFELPLFGEDYHGALMLADLCRKEALGKDFLQRLKREIVRLLDGQSIADDVNYIAISRKKEKENDDESSTV